MFEISLAGFLSFSSIFFFMKRHLVIEYRYLLNCRKQFEFPLEVCGKCVIRNHTLVIIYLNILQCQAE